MHGVPTRTWMSTLQHLPWATRRCQLPWTTMRLEAAARGSKKRALAVNAATKMRALAVNAATQLVFILAADAATQLVLILASAVDAATLLAATQLAATHLTCGNALGLSAAAHQGLSFLHGFLGTSGVRRQRFVTHSALAYLQGHRPFCACMLNHAGRSGDASCHQHLMHKLLCLMCILRRRVSSRFSTPPPWA